MNTIEFVRVVLETLRDMEDVVDVIYRLDAEAVVKQWQELKETITELRDNDGTGTQQEVCKFLANLMDILEKQMEEPCKVSEYDKDHIWYRGKQYISLRRFLEVKSEKKNKPCEDCISRQAVKDILDERGVKAVMTFEHFKKLLDNLQSVTPQQKMGKWIAQDIHNCHTDFKCSECGYTHNFTHLYGEPTADYTYCPNCGAKMERLRNDNSREK